MAMAIVVALVEGLQTNHLQTKQTSINNHPLLVNNQVNILQCERGLGTIAQWLAYLAPYPAALDSTPGVSENFP